MIRVHRQTGISANFTHVLPVCVPTYPLTGTFRPAIHIIRNIFYKSNGTQWSVYLVKVQQFPLVTV